MVFDASNNINRPDFQRQIQLTKDLVSELDIGQGKTRVGLIAFGGEYMHRVINLDSNHFDKVHLKSKISRVYRLHGRSYPDRALLHAREMIRREGRKEAEKFIVLMTNGQSEFPQLTRDEATKSKTSGITIVTVGVGVNVNEVALRQIASKKDYMFTKNDDVKEMKEKLTNTNCDVQGDSPYGYYRRENTILKESKTNKLAKGKVMFIRTYL